MAGLIENRNKAIAAVGHQTDQNVARQTSRLFEPGLLPLKDVVSGKYQCRVIKMGADLSVVYGYFSCEITENGQGNDRDWTIIKTGGSQRFSGVLKPGGDGLVYIGAGFVAGEKAPKYGDSTETDEVGCLYRAADAPRHYVLELPRPQFEFHDVVELVPVK